jgi:hypothetical protein
MSNRQSANLFYLSDRYPPQHQQEDEINLIDIFQILVRQKQIIFRVALACLLLSSAFSLLRQTRHDVSAVVQIGSLHNDAKGMPIPIEMTQDVLEKIKAAYIPFVLAQSIQKNTDNATGHEIVASVPKNANIISLKTSCKPTDEQVCKSLVDEVVEKIKADHSLITGVTTKNLQVKLASAENALKSSRDEVKYIASKRQRLSQSSELLSSQLKEKKTMLVSTLKNRGKIKSGNAVGAMLALQVDNEIKKNQELIDGLEQRLSIGINQDLDELDIAEKNNGRLQNEQENAIGQIKNQLLSVNKTKAIVPVLMSDKPVGISSLLIVLISTLLGVFFGVIAAFFYEFLGKVKEQNERTAV